MDKVLTDAPVPQPRPDPGQGVTGSGVGQALTELANTNILGSKQRRQSLAAANRYSNASCDDDQGRCDNMQAGNPAQTSIAVPYPWPQRMGSGAATFDRRRSSQRNAGGTQHEPLKWQLPESSRHLGEHRLGRSGDDALRTSNAQGVSADQLPQQLSWTARGAGSPQTLKAWRRVAGKQPAAAAGKSRGPKVSGTTARQQENDCKSAAATQSEADTMELSRSQAAELNSSAVDQRESLAEASSLSKRRRASLVHLQMRIRSRHAARRPSLPDPADMAEPGNFGPEATAPQVPCLNLPTSNNMGQPVPVSSAPLEKALAKANAAAPAWQGAAEQQPSNYQIAAWRSGDAAFNGSTDDLQPCSKCGRTFNAQALAVHERVCLKVFAGKAQAKTKTDAAQGSTQNTPV
ncbi:g237 [Coccomyxa elongata]